MSKKRVSDTIPMAHTVQWMGLCPCGCGAYRAVLVDGNDECIAAFGWDKSGWVSFLGGVIGAINGEESNDQTACEHHTPH